MLIRKLTVVYIFTVLCFQLDNSLNYIVYSTSLYLKLTKIAIARKSVGSFKDLILPFLVLKTFFFKTIDFAKNIGMTQIAGGAGGGGSEFLRHYDAVHTRTDI